MTMETWRLIVTLVDYAAMLAVLIGVVYTIMITIECLIMFVREEFFEEEEELEEVKL